MWKSNGKGQKKCPRWNGHQRNARWSSRTNKATGVTGSGKAKWKQYIKGGGGEEGRNKDREGKYKENLCRERLQDIPSWPPP